MGAFTSLLVAVDFSPCSAAALRAALWLAGKCGGAVNVVHVLDTLVIIEQEESFSKFQQDIRAGLIAGAEKEWARFAAEIPGADALPFRVAINNRILGVVKAARETHADLVVAGAYGTRPPDTGMGTMATALVRKAMADVLLVRDTHEGVFSSIVAGVDFSPTSAKALERAVAMAALSGGDVHAVHVYRGPWLKMPFYLPAPEIDPADQRQHREGMQARLEKFCESASAQHPSVRVLPKLFDFAQGHRSGIVDYARTVNADLIVLGTRGSTNLRDVLLGSTAEKTLQESECSILTVKPDGFEHPMSLEGKHQA